jgi:type I restriction enzyme M protein
LKRHKYTTRPKFLKEPAKPIMVWCEEQGITLNASARAKLLDTSYWKRLRERLAAALHPRSKMQAAPTSTTFFQ